ncbi:sulfopropanediol 3-dehydrogenase [Alteribacillus bidgolensis]|uniref:Sulfopropanediol 3-dehydrogenase n=1 Tax=Alteribacillus bidgolensis TaxID=930129 RepID=A0A1G8HGP2_9BACI|nr:sulfopropanediol 3-dehydrogenase [Alteribacillus bidgolensis]
MVATDILGQAEHGPTSPGALISTSKELAESLEDEISRRLKSLSTADVAEASWRDNGSIILVDSLEEAVTEADKLTYEHVEVITDDPDSFLKKSIKLRRSVFRTRNKRSIRR